MEGLNNGWRSYGEEEEGVESKRGSEEKRRNQRNGKERDCFYKAGNGADARASWGRLGALHWRIQSVLATFA